MKSHIERAAIASAPSVELVDNEVAALLEGCAEQLLDGAGSRSSRRSSYEHHGPAPTSPGNLIKRAVAAATSKWNSLMQKQQPQQLPVPGGSPRRSGWEGHDSLEPAGLHGNLGELMDLLSRSCVCLARSKGGLVRHSVPSTYVACPQRDRPVCTVHSYCAVPCLPSAGNIPPPPSDRPSPTPPYQPRHPQVPQTPFCPPTMRKRPPQGRLRTCAKTLRRTAACRAPTSCCTKPTTATTTRLIPSPATHGGRTTANRQRACCTVRQRC